MATVNKNFRIKHGLVVEGTSGTINGQAILTETGSDQYILNLIGGETLVKSVANEFNVSGGGELSIDRTVVDTWYDASGAAASAQAAAEATASADATSKANAAQAAAEATASADATSKANAAQAAAEATASADATSKANAAQAAAEATASADATSKANAAQAAAEATASADATSKANAAQAAAEGYTDTQLEDYTPTSSLDATVDGYGYLKSADLSGYATESYVGTAIDNLVDGAPGLLDTLNEIAAAINDDANYATTMTTALAGKQDNLTASTGITIDGSNNISVTANTYDAYGAASAAQAAAEATASADATSKANAAQAAAEATASADATSKANAAQAAAEATAQAALDDVLDATTPFTDLNINDVAKQVAARTTSLGSVVVTAYQFNKSTFKSGKFLVKIDNGTHNEISEILVTLDSSDNVAITEYAIVGTNGSRGTITADVDGTHCRIRVNPVNDSTITVSGTVFNA